MASKKDTIQKMMEKLHISEQEALELIADDDAIDHGAKLFELSKEQEQVSKQARQVGKSPTVYKLDNEKGKRSKKSDDNKSFLIDLFRTVILPYSGEIEVINPEREFTFIYNGRKFKLVLSCPRS